jgi:hypothetical protein
MKLKAVMSHLISHSLGSKTYNVIVSSALIDIAPRQGRRKPKKSTPEEDDPSMAAKQSKAGAIKEDLFFKDKQEKFIEPPVLKQADIILQQSYAAGSVGKVFV